MCVCVCVCVDVCVCVFIVFKEVVRDKLTNYIQLTDCVCVCGVCVCVFIVFKVACVVLVGSFALWAALPTHLIFWGSV